MGRAVWGAPDFSSLATSQAWSMLREATLERRLQSVREVMHTLLQELESLSTSLAHGNDNPKLQEAVRRFETQLIRSALEKTHGNQARAAKLLGVKHTTLNAKIKRYRIPIGSASVGEVSNQEIAA